MKIDVEDVVYMVANVTPNMYAGFQICLPNVETVATTRHITNTECVTNQLVRLICCVSSSGQMWFLED